MPRQDTLKGTIEDALRSLYVGDFSGGLNTEKDPQDLELNESPDCQNVRVNRAGRLEGRGGFSVQNSLAAKPDGDAFFFDNNGYRHEVVFANGNIYDCVSGTAVLINSTVYTAGLRVAVVQQNGKLYWSDGETIFTSGITQSGIWYWDPVTSPSAAALVISSGAAGAIATPAAKALTSYTGCLVLGNLRYTTGAYDHHAVIWSGVNDPTTILGSNIFQLAQGQGGEIVAITPMGVSTVGVTPYQALFVGKTGYAYQLKGALSPDSLSEILIDAPTGVLEQAADTVKFIPVAEGSGAVVWLGGDYKVYGSNGVGHIVFGANIKTELAQYVEEALGNGNARFTAARNFNASQYILDVGGGVQYAFDWTAKAWTRYSGWPSGYWMETKTSNGQNAIKVADRTNNRLCLCDDGTTDNGSAINPYWKTGHLSAGDPDLYKMWQWVIAAYATDDGNVVFTAAADLGNGGSSSVTFTNSSTSTDAEWDAATAIWDTSVWSAARFETFTKYKKKGRLIRTTQFANVTQLLGGFDLQVQVGCTTVGGHFEILGFDLLYLPRGRKRVAVQS